MPTDSVFPRRLLNASSLLVTFCKVVRTAARTGRKFVGRRFMKLRVVMDLKNDS